MIVNFRTCWCSYCREEMSALESCYRRHKRRGLRIVAVTIDDDSSRPLQGGAARIAKAFPRRCPPAMLRIRIAKV